MIPEFELWVKASNIDKMSKGACPLCHQWYMVAYILAENKLASFKVITVPENCPPKILKDKSTSGLFPVVVGISGATTLGSVEDFVADESSELEAFFDSFKCPLLSMNSPGQTVALDCFIDLYRVFNLFLKSNTEKLRDKLNNVMKRIDTHLKENGTKFLDRDVLTYADCVLLPRLQHVRVAGKIYVDYEIPAENKYLYRYLVDSYATDAFRDTCPSDPVIINHYQKKAQKQGVEATLMKETTTFHIPDYIDLTFDEEEDEATQEQDDMQQLSDQVHSIAVDSTPNGDAASEPVHVHEHEHEANCEDIDDAASASSVPTAEELIANGDVSSNMTKEKYEAELDEIPAVVGETGEMKSVRDEVSEHEGTQISENGSAVAAE